MPKVTESKDWVNSPPNTNCPYCDVELTVNNSGEESRGTLVECPVCKKDFYLEVHLVTRYLAYKKED